MSTGETPSYAKTSSRTNPDFPLSELLSLFASRILTFPAQGVPIMTIEDNRRLPLDGLRVVELGQLIAGPFATKMLGEFGADVIKVEPPGTGDPLRRWRMIEDGTSLW